MFPQMNPMMLAALLQQQQQGPQMTPPGAAPGPMIPQPPARGANVGPMMPLMAPQPQAGGGAANGLLGAMGGGAGGNPMQSSLGLLAQLGKGAAPSPSPGPQIGPSAGPNNTSDFGALSVDQLRKMGFGSQPGLMSWLNGLFGGGAGGVPGG